MGKSWKPGRQIVELEPVAARPSRIRRDPIRTVADQPSMRIRRTDEEELWFGVSGVLLTAIALGIIVIGLGVITFVRSGTAAAPTFRQCYNGGSSCVVDGDTFRLDGNTVTIAGIRAPRLKNPACPAEREAGIRAALALEAMLNEGPVTLGQAGASTTKVAVAGQDLASRMLAQSLVRGPDDAGGWDPLESTCRHASLSIL